MKWYAAYSGVGEYEIINEVERAKEIEEKKDTDESERSDYLFNMLEFKTFNEAKKWIRGGIACDIGDLKVCLYNLKKQRAK